MTAEQFKVLSKYEKHFKTAEASYIRGIYHSDIIVLSPIYNALGYSIDNINCPDCILTMFKRLAKEYNKYKKYAESRAKRKTE
jgi:hypothetical protein